MYTYPTGACNRNKSLIQHRKYKEQYNILNANNNIYNLIIIMSSFLFCLTSTLDSAAQMRC